VPRIFLPARLRSADTERQERHATWFELFFDLFFVLAVSQLSSLLQSDTTPSGFLKFVALFVPVWWAWAICGGAATFELATGLIHAAHHGLRDRLFLERALAALVLLALAAVGASLLPLVLLGSLLLVHMVQVAIELVWHEPDV
jgi:low temperature requirement protein LtrA